MSKLKDHPVWNRWVAENDRRARQSDRLICLAILGYLCWGVYELYKFLY